MSSATLKSATAELLERLHKTVRMGADSTMALLPKPDKEATGLKSELTVCLDGYEKFTHRIEALLREGGEQALNDSLWNKMTGETVSIEPVFVACVSPVNLDARRDALSHLGHVVTDNDKHNSHKSQEENVNVFGNTHGDCEH